MRVAVLGMGRMGHAIAARLLAGGHAVTVWNRTPHKADDLLSHGAREAETPAHAAREAEAAFVSLADDAAVRSVVTRPDGAGAAIGSGVLVDASTVSPETTALEREATGGRSLASPVLGSPTAVALGAATYLIGGPEELYERLGPAFDALADDEHRRYVDPDATRATSLKLISNYLLMSGITALAEAVATAQAVGLPDGFIRDYFGHTPLVAPGLRNRLDDIVSGNHEGWFSTTLGAKDVHLAVQLAREHGVRLRLAETVEQRYEEAKSNGLGEADIAAVVELARAGT